MDLLLKSLVYFTFLNSSLMNDGICTVISDHQPHAEMSVLEGMNAGCLAVPAKDHKSWINNTKRYIPRCIARDEITYTGRSINIWTVVQFLYFGLCNSPQWI